MSFKTLISVKGEDMSDKKKIPDNEVMILADLEAYRTGEEHDLSSYDQSMGLMKNRIIEDLDQISELFSSVKPDPGEIPASVDNFVLEHIKEKSREIRRDRKVVRLFPRYKWAAAAAMGVLVCVVSFNFIYKMDKRADTSLKDNTTPVLTEFPRDTNEKTQLNNQNQQHVKSRLASFESIKDKHASKRVSAEIPDNDLETLPDGLAKDIDGNGRVDIIDAYIMDRRLMSGVNVSKKLDLNGDGNVNREDVNSIVKTAVSLGRGEV